MEQKWVYQKRRLKRTVWSDGSDSDSAGEERISIFKQYFWKQSSGDLQSRLKTRKILGVGETDNGDIHRSKISQVLGHNEHLYVKLPRCYWLWHLAMALLCTAAGMTNFLAPNTKQSFSVMAHHRSEENAPSLDLANRLYGSALLGFAVLLWNLLGVTDKYLVRGLILVIALCQIMQLSALCIYAWQENAWDSRMNWQISGRIIIAAGNLYFFWAIGSSTAGPKKCTSYKDLSDKELASEEQQEICTSSASTALPKDNKKTE